MSQRQEQNMLERPAPTDGAKGQEDEHLIHGLDGKTEGEHATMKKNTRLISIAICIGCLLLGVGSGYLLSQKAGGAKATGGQSTITGSDKVAGSTDSKTFKDSAVGIVQKGGMNGEGTHQLIREGGPSQTAYLTSSIVDLDEYVGKKVKVWGQTMTAKRVSWLMDVGKVEIQE